MEKHKKYPESKQSYKISFYRSGFLTRSEVEVAFWGRP